MKTKVLVSVGLATAAAGLAIAFGSTGAAAPSGARATPPTKPSLTTPLPAEHVQVLRRFSECMRQRGLADYPDPAATGELSLPERYRQPDPALRATLDAAGAACKREVAR